MITIVTGNSGKYKQIASVLEEGGFLVKQQKIDLIEPQSNDMLEISQYKAMQAFEVVGGPVIVDDSGIYFEAYDKFPGVFSKYIYKSLGLQGLQRLFINQQNIRAYYQCVLSYLDETLEHPQQFVGYVHGNIHFENLRDITIDPHLPYDAFFQADGMDVVAQMDIQSFQMMHHRFRASIKLREYLMHN